MGNGGASARRRLAVLAKWIDDAHLVSAKIQHDHHDGDDGDDDDDEEDEGNMRTMIALGT